LSGTLYLVPAPLGGSNWSISEELKEKIAGIRYFAAENARTARRQLKALKPVLPLQEIRFLDLDAEAEAALKILLREEDVGVMSEAGCPGVADPGAKLVALAHESDVRVVPLPGASAIVLALMASGMNGQRFAFRGYLPVEKKSRRAKIEELEKDSSARDETQIFIETPYRNQPMLDSLLAVLSPHTRLCLASDLTCDTQTVRTSTVEQWKKLALKLGKRPTVFLISASRKS
jgi:16S rRNA (cytidine1402-2'-O)-methyltransferase